MANENITAYPLCWPSDWKRTLADGRTRQGRYKVGLSKALDHLLGELRKMGAQAIVISTNIPARLDGKPYAGASEPRDPGVAVYWQEKRWWNGEYIEIPKVIACDKWNQVVDNVHAIGLAVQALRALERSGASEVSDRAQAAIGMLPQDTTKCPWWEVLGVDVEMWRSRPTKTERLNEVDEKHVALTKVHHPDLGGDTEMMAEINRARDEAYEEIGR